MAAEDEQGGGVAASTAQEPFSDLRSVLGLALQSKAGEALLQRRSVVTSPRGKMLFSDGQLQKGKYYEYGEALAQGFRCVANRSADETVLPDGMEEEVAALLRYLSQTVHAEPALSAKGLLARWGYRTVVITRSARWRPWIAPRCTMMSSHEGSLQAEEQQALEKLGGTLRAALAKALQSPKSGHLIRAAADVQGCRLNLYGGAHAFGQALALSWLQLTNGGDKCPPYFRNFEEEFRSLTDLLEYLLDACASQPEATAADILSRWGYCMLSNCFFWYVCGLNFQRQVFTKDRERKAEM
eukprot:TRINITY_DN21232_c0_g1_i1.p1 TRINITY_DN21232_c0_g1~~TRINITY_DN21232_c0_g1_i1.p1  ORF type:complete len:298 (+),score=55.47 TRINITY_DN21232_c0_g1_i1:363-1256(+)